METVKTKPKKKTGSNNDRAVLDRIIKKNPNVKTLIDKFDLEITKTSKS